MILFLIASTSTIWIVPWKLLWIDDHGLCGDPDHGLFDVVDYDDGGRFWSVCREGRWSRMAASCCVTL